MKFFNIFNMISISLFAILLGISNTYAVPLTRIISDSLKTRENSQTMSSNRNQNVPMTLENPRETATPMKRFPPVLRNVQPAGSRSGSAFGLRMRRSVPVVRSRRQAEESAECLVSADMPVVEANDLDTLLNATTFLGLNPSQPEIPSIPHDQPHQCPSLFNQWWPRVEENLRSTCPWRWDVADMSEEFGNDVFPRYVRTATCLCERCVMANSMGCSELRQPMTVFQKIGCQNGLAVMLKKTVDVTVGCHCHIPAPNASTRGTGLPLEDD